MKKSSKNKNKIKMRNNCYEWINLVSKKNVDKKIKIKNKIKKGC